MKISFQLTMPNVGSWNGQWTGANKQYFRIRSYMNKDKKRILELMNGQTKKGALVEETTNETNSKNTIRNNL